MSSEEFHSDIAVSSEEQDAFQRYGYAKRIAHTIEGHKSSNSLVVGIYAKWGEGKTSMLNFIRKELHDKGIVAIDFNPWTYSNEDKMLLAFFQALAKGLSIEVKGRKGDIGKFMADYASGIGVLSSLLPVGNTEEFAKEMGVKLSAVATNELKKKVDDYLEMAGKKIVVFVDDIDRLTTSEVQDLFRVIKLIGNFKNTVYILAFDDQMVAKSLDDIYSGGGQDYLEKIVQLPLKLPKAQSSLLRKYVIEALNDSISEIDFVLDENGSREFSETFTEHILWQIKSPRFAVRYVNSIAFAIPLLQGEVNMVDLFTIEAIKVLDSELYDFISQHSAELTDNYDDWDIRDSLKNRKTEAKSIVTNFLARYQEIERERYSKLLCHLFPQLKELLNRGSNYSGGWKRRYEEKRISSGAYIGRYFSYTVPTGQMSDVTFGHLIQEITAKDYQNSPQDLTNLMKDVEASSFLFKLVRLEESFNSDVLSSLARNLALTAELFPNDDQYFFGIGNNYWLLVRFIQRSIVSQPDAATTMKLARQVLLRANPLDFAFEIRFSLYRLKNDPYDMKIGEDALEKLSLLLYERARQGRTLRILYDELEETSFRELLRIGSLKFKESIMAEVRELIEKESDMFIHILHTFCNTLRSSSQPEPYKTGFDDFGYGMLSDAVSVDYFYKKSISLYGKQSDAGDGDDREPKTDQQLVAAFQKLYLKLGSDKVLEK